MAYFINNYAHRDEITTETHIDPPAISRGTVWWTDLPLDENTFVIGGARPCLVVSADFTIHPQGVVTVIPLSTKLDSYSHHYPLTIQSKQAQALIEQITTVDVRYISNYAGSVSETDMQNIDKMVMRQLGLTPIPTPHIRVTADNTQTPVLIEQFTNINNKLDKILSFIEFLMWKFNK